MKVVEIRHEAEWQKLQSGWEALLQDSVSATIFLSWEWTEAWWSAYGVPGELRILAAFDERDVLRGVAPMRLRKVRRYGQTVPVLSFLADGSNDSDYLDFLSQRGYEQPVVEAFSRHWRDALEGGTVLLLNEISEASPNLPLLRARAEASGWRCQEAEVPCGTIRLPRTWEEYLATLKPRFRTKVRSVLRNLENRPEVRFGFCQGADDLPNLLSTLFDLHTRRWAAEGKPGVFGWDRKRDFYFALSENLLRAGRLRFNWLEWKGRILACQYGFVYGDTYFQLQEGYEPEAEHWNVGIGLRAWSIREFLAQGLREYDFMAGLGRHKLDWGAEVKNSKRILLADTCYRNVLFCRVPEWDRAARELVNRIVPERILAARRARRLRAASSPPGKERPQAQGTRNALARCYFYLPFAQLVKPLRELYQLSITRRGKGCRISLEKRTEAVARILCFHRVNNDRDPFFPSLPGETFERQMRHVARHYKVVSLTELLDRLEGGSTEPVLAITFDDGYRDNWENAFPILQRYGLPATIFLTTGSIDTQEPLWFERLALALKMTRREFLDLELETPRRFWLRTQAERLQANTRLLAMLRRVPDETRRGLLAEIIRLLAAGDSTERHGKMLPWDEVRLMKAHGIDFGSHTVTHPFISKAPREQVEWEVTHSKRRIEEELQCRVDHFAYPNGREEDFGLWNKDVVRSAGYRAAVTTIWGVNYSSTDRMELRRGQPWEEDPALFAYKLDWYSLVNG